MNFKSWLKQSKYIKENNKCGDFARDIISDKNFPRAVEKYVIHKYLSSYFDSDLERYFEFMYSDFIKFISRTYSDEED